MISTAPDKAGGSPMSSGCRPTKIVSAFVEEQDQAEGREHLLDMVARIEAPDHHELDQQAGGSRGCQRDRYREQERAGLSRP